MKVYQADPDRKDYADLTGIYVRAIEDGHPSSVDIACLDRESLLDWLRSRGGNNEWAEHVVLLLLHHKSESPK